MALRRAFLAALVAAACTGGDEGSAATGGASLTAASSTTGGGGSATGAQATGEGTGSTGADTDPAPTGTGTSTTTGGTAATSTCDGDACGTTATATTGGDPGLDPDAPPVTEGRWYRPGLSATWNYQLTGELVTTYDIDVYVIDLFDTDAAAIAALQAEGRAVLCYFSAGSGEDWRPDYDQLDPAALGQPLDGWPGEVWLDFRHPSVQAVMRARLDLAAEKGCDGVDPDNVDGYTQDSGFSLGATDQIAYNRWLGNRAHERGLAVGLKNDLEQVPELVDYFDLAVNEECHEYDECDLLAPFTSAGKPVFNVEYPGDETDAAVVAPDLCPQSIAADLRTVFLPLELDGSWRLACD